jgi:hypothetical protein
MVDSAGAAPTPPKPETFRPPELTSLASLTDGRQPGDYKSVYPWAAWIQIIVEFIYLIAVELICIGLLFGLAIYAVRKQETGFFFNVLGPYPASAPVVAYLSIAFSGACGGCTFPSNGCIIRSQRCNGIGIEPCGASWSPFRLVS